MTLYPNGWNVSYVYDEAGRLLNQTSTEPTNNPNTVKTTTNAYTYDDQGNIKTETKSRSGVQGSYVITHSYDELNRLIKTVRPEGEDGNSQGGGGHNISQGAVETPRWREQASALQGTERSE